MKRYRTRTVTMPNKKKRIMVSITNGDFNTDDVMDFEETLNSHIKEVKNLVRIISKKDNNVIGHWNLGKELLNFQEYAISKNMDFLSLQIYIDNIGNSKSYYSLHKTFVKIYPSKDAVNPKVPWKMYLPLMREKSETNKKIFEKNILNGIIENQQVVWGLLNIPTNELQKRIKELADKKKFKKKPPPFKPKKLTLSQQKVIDALKKGDMNQYEVAELTGLSHHGVRGRITELRHRFRFNIKIVDDKYHLDENED